MGLHEQAIFVERNECVNCQSSRLNELSRGQYTDRPLIDYIEADPWGVSPVPFLSKAEWILVQCKDCSQVFHKRILSDAWNEKRFTYWMSEEAMRKFELNIAKRSSLASLKFEKARRNVEHVISLDTLTKDLRKQRDAMRVLDFGCGWGEFISACQLFGAEAYGVDRAVARKSGALIEILPSLDELNELPLFHAVTLFEVLEHLDAPALILREVAKRLMPGGILVLETPDCSGVSGIESHDDYRKIHPLEHINAFTNETLISIAKRNGFIEISRGSTFVTGKFDKVIKRKLKNIFSFDRKSTQLYFRMAI